MGFRVPHISTRLFFSFFLFFLFFSTRWDQITAKGRRGGLLIGEDRERIERERERERREKRREREYLVLIEKGLI